MFLNDKYFNSRSPQTVPKGKLKSQDFKSLKFLSVVVFISRCIPCLNNNYKEACLFLSNVFACSLISLLLENSCPFVSFLGSNRSIWTATIFYFMNLVDNLIIDNSPDLWINQDTALHCRNYHSSLKGFPSLIIVIFLLAEIRASAYMVSSSLIVADDLPLRNLSRWQLTFLFELLLTLLISPLCDYIKSSFIIRI